MIVLEGKALVGTEVGGKLNAKVVDKTPRDDPVDTDEVDAVLLLECMELLPSPA